MELIFPYLTTINEKAVAENIDLKTAYNLTYELREYRQLGSLQNTVKHTKQQLSVLNVFNEQQKQAIATFISLQNAGIGSEKEIRELIGLVNMWNKHLRGMTQGNGNSVNGNRSKLDEKLIGAS